MENPNEGTLSLNKFISQTGVCSRREADELIEEGRVTLNGVVAIKGNRAGENDVVLVDGKPLGEAPKRVYIALNKPVGIVCTTDAREPRNIIKHIGYPERLFPIGRLDKLSEGLIFLTNDGDIVNKILRAGNAHEKEYIVRVDQPINEKFIQRMSVGVPILNTRTKPCTVVQIDEYRFKIILIQGLNRQIRRMCEFFGYEVKALKRIRIMHINVDNMKPGEWRELKKKEVQELELAVADSVK